MSSKTFRVVEENKNFEVLRKEGAVRIMPENILLPEHFETMLHNLLNFKLRSSDVFIFGHPRTGTTWTQEIIWNMTNNVDFNHKLKDESTYAKSLYLELPIFPENLKPFLDIFFENFSADKKPKGNYTHWECLEDMPNPRVLKSHLPPTLVNPDLLKTCKVVFVIRDPKDTILSYFYLCKSISVFNFKGNLEEFVDLYMKEQVIFGAMPQLVKAWWPYRIHKNVYFMIYEELRRDTLNEMKKLNEFLGTQLTEEQLSKLRDYCSLEEMKARDQILGNKDERTNNVIYTENFGEYGGVLRKGLIGESKEVFSADLHYKLENYLKEAFEEIDLPYDYLKN